MLLIKNTMTLSSKLDNQISKKLSFCTKFHNVLQVVTGNVSDEFGPIVAEALLFVLIYFPICDRNLPLKQDSTYWHFARN
jgi:hypothetical protein